MVGVIAVAATLVSVLLALGPDVVGIVALVAYGVSAVAGVTR